MSIRKSIFATALVLISVFAGAADCKKLKDASCDPAKKAAAVAQAPSPECSLPPFVSPSFTPAGVVIGDGVYEVGKDMPAGKWQSVGYPMENAKCIWFVTPAPSADPNGQSLPSYNDFKHGERYVITFKVLPNQGFFTKDCGDWKLVDPYDIR